MRWLSDKTRVLVPLELPDPEEIPRSVVELLGGTRVVLLGWYEVPEQTPPEQARAAAEDTGAEALEAVAAGFRDAGAEVEVHHVFTPDLVATVQRIGAEQDCDAALISGPAERLERILVVLREGVSGVLVGDLVSDLSARESRTFTVLQISEDAADDGRDWADEVLDRLEERGVDTDRVETRVETSEDPGARVLEICREGDYDALVVPERGNLEDRLFGSLAERLAWEADVPVLVARGGGRRE